MGIVQWLEQPVSGPCAYRLNGRKWATADRQPCPTNKGLRGDPKSRPIVDDLCHLTSRLVYAPQRGMA